MPPRTDHIVFHAAAPSVRRPIPRLLPGHVARPVRVSDPPNPVYEAFARWVLHRAGLSAQAYRAKPLVRRVPACLRALRATTIEEARQAIERSVQAMDTAVCTLLIGVTEFFRDPFAFDALAAWMKLRESSGQPTWRVWSVACSDGAELYTVAMLLHRMGALQRSELIGSDCRGAAITRAKAALYPRDLTRSLPDTLRDLLQDKGSFVQPVEAIRESARWQVSDVLRDAAPPGTFDLVLCRNMGIYLDSAAAGKLWKRLSSALKVGGLLMTGHAERPHGTPELRRMASCLYLKEHP